MAQESEIVSLLMALALTPVMYASVRRLEFAGKRALMSGLVLLLCAYVFTVLEGFVLFDVLNVLEHLSLAGASIAMAVGVVRLRSGQPSGETP